MVLFMAIKEDFYLVRFHEHVNEKKLSMTRTISGVLLRPNHISCIWRVRLWQTVAFPWTDRKFSISASFQSTIKKRRPLSLALNEPLQLQCAYFAMVCFSLVFLPDVIPEELQIIPMLDATAPEGMPETQDSLKTLGLAANVAILESQGEHGTLVSASAHHRGHREVRLAAFGPSGLCGRCTEVEDQSSRICEVVHFVRDDFLLSLTLEKINLILLLLQIENVYFCSSVWWLCVLKFSNFNTTSISSSEVDVFFSGTEVSRIPIHTWIRFSVTFRSLTFGNYYWELFTFVGCFRELFFAVAKKRIRVFRELLSSSFVWKCEQIVLLKTHL